MCETMQSSHRLSPAMALVRALLAPTLSGDDAGERFCAPLTPSPPRFRGIDLKTLDEFQESQFCIFILSSVWSGESWAELERLREKW